MSFDRNEYNNKLKTAKEAVQLVNSGDRVFIGFASSIAYALADRRDELEDVTVVTCHSARPTPLLGSDGTAPFLITTPFQGPGERTATRNGSAVDFTSFHLSQVDIWINRVARPNVCFLAVSLPNEEGYFSYGPSGGCVNTFARDRADRIILQVDPNIPYITGEHCLIHLSEADAITESNEPLLSLGEGTPDETAREISRQILPLIPDGATIQLGIGELSTAVGYGLRERNDLGIHSELFSEPFMHLIKNGNVSNAKKGFLDGLSVFSFAMGSSELYRFMDHNQSLYAGTFPFVNDVRNVAKNRRMISINSAMSIDLYGQVAADAMEWRQHSGVGGQLDFVRGAQWSEEGKSIIATNSSFVKNGVRRSKIVLSFPEGTAVTTPRSDVQYVATEYGCVNLKELPMKDRVREMISLAHPDFRDELLEKAREKKLL